MEVYNVKITRVHDEYIIEGELPEELEQGDIIVHKGTPHYVFVSYLKVLRPNVELQPIMPGTEPYVQVGSDSSYISKKY